MRKAALKQLTDERPTAFGKKLLDSPTLIHTMFFDSPVAFLSRSLSNWFEKGFQTSNYLKNSLALKQLTGERPTLFGKIYFDCLTLFHIMHFTSRTLCVKIFIGHDPFPLLSFSRKSFLNGLPYLTRVLHCRMECDHR